jgi:hypothetical protein
MVEQGHQPGGWNNYKAYPLLVSQIVDHALVKMQADRNLTRGKALNIVILEGLYGLGYLVRPKTPQQLREEASRSELEWVKGHRTEMSEKASKYWMERYPEAFTE